MVNLGPNSMDCSESESESKSEGQNQWTVIANSVNVLPTLKINYL